MGSPSTPTTDRRWLRLGSAAELLGVLGYQVTTGRGVE